MTKDFVTQSIPMLYDSYSKSKHNFIVKCCQQVKANLNSRFTQGINLDPMESLRLSHLMLKQCSDG